MPLVKEYLDESCHRLNTSKKLKKNEGKKNITTILFAYTSLATGCCSSLLEWVVSRIHRIWMIW